MTAKERKYLALWSLKRLARSVPKLGGYERARGNGKKVSKGKRALGWAVLISNYRQGFKTSQGREERWAALS
jgi:hypothetical protein